MMTALTRTFTDGEFKILSAADPSIPLPPSPPPPSPSPKVAAPTSAIIAPSPEYKRTFTMVGDLGIRQGLVQLDTQCSLMWCNPAEALIRLLFTSLCVVHDG